MKKRKMHPSELRAQAEERLKRKPAGKPPGTADEAARLMHELEVHQIELEMQNESLMASRAETEAGLERYTELFDFAPLGYAILGADEVIREINHAGAKLLGNIRSRLVGMRFGMHVAAA